ncbi:hypothetical protein [Piscinibacter sp. HJYY11]|uniref:hypothetical protein n=1 Tax=Piscinibacter sp. HJYY11 TaxID=2801333 RepID=UPI00191E0FF6|nr:hypothetical protein [Piscinibacter sp. HJYY11]MBL0729668.1 hypothetical protein [Piscinibacter sp. HJYY11]
MKSPIPRVQSATALLVALLLAACVNLHDVSTYSSSAADVVGNKSAAVRWRDSEKILLRTRLEGDTCEIGRTGRKPQAQFDAAYIEIAALHDALSTYFLALGELASGDVPAVSSKMNATLDAVKDYGLPVNARDEAATRSLFAVLNRSLDAYRHQNLRKLMDETHEDVTQVVTLLTRLADVYVGEINGERVQAVNFVRCSIGQADLTDKFLGRREIDRTRRKYEQDTAVLTQYKAALQKVAQDHEAIRKALAYDKSSLKRSLKATAATAKELNKAAQALSNL